MPDVKSLLRLFCCVLFLAWAVSTQDVVAEPHTPNMTESSTPESAVEKGRELERSRFWIEAIEHYEAALKTWPKDEDLRYGLRRSKIHFGVDRRYSDKSFTRELLGKSDREALDLLDEVLRQIRTRYVEPISATSFIAHGTESLYMALANEKFRDWHAASLNADPRGVSRVRGTLRERFWNKPLENTGHARRVVIEVCEIASRFLNLPRTAVVMEYVFGGCNALDDYSSYLTPDRLDDLYGNIDGEFVGLGIEMKAEPGKGLLLVNVLPDGPAAEGGLLPGDHVVRIDAVDCMNLTTDEAATLLRGPEGSSVKLTFHGSSHSTHRERVFVRRPVHVKSITEARIIDKANGIGYIRMTGFQKTSPAEMDAAMHDLMNQGIRSLIWDLRGNPGGLLPAAVEVLDRFIDEGVLVSTRGRTADQNFTYSAYRAGTYRMPLVLLVDGDSASASEIVAGAIRDHDRGIVVGRTTYGKWSVQSIYATYPSRHSPGLRLTTARFYSPSGRTLDKVGLRPDILVERPEQEHTAFYHAAHVDLVADADVREGIRVLRRQLSSR